MERVKKFIRDEQGLEAVEYAVILGFIVVGSLGLICALGLWASRQFSLTVADITK